METLYEAITHHAESNPEKVAITTSHDTMTYSALLAAIHQLDSTLPLDYLSGTVAIDLENHCAWAVLDISMMPHKTATLPIPPFFSDMQIKHAIQDAGADVVITDRPARYTRIMRNKVEQVMSLTIAGQLFTLFKLNIAAQTLPESTAKVTYTSGTTGTPKGVCLSTNAMMDVAKSVMQETQLTPDNKHLAVLPLATLLENVAGLYANLFAGGTTYLLPMTEVGFNGSQFNLQQLIHTLRAIKANTVILMPGMLAQLVEAYESGTPILRDLRFVAVGGASVAPDLLMRAKQVDLPVYEGYGLSESSSVVALNTATSTKVGSVGKPLSHLEVKVSEHHEILVKGANHLGYIGHPAPTSEWLPTGDIGYQDEDGYLYISGRKSNLFITAYGRNISPEWLERDLINTSAIVQACVFGEAKPWNIALIVAENETSAESIDLAITIINQRLPQYARITQWIRAESPFTVKNNQLTPNGRLRRDKIWEKYQTTIDARYAVEALIA